MRYYYSLASGRLELHSVCPDERGNYAEIGKEWKFYDSKNMSQELIVALKKQELLSLQKQYTAAAQAYLDDFARTKTYDGILSACTYATSTSQRLREEGKLCVELRDAVWETAFTILNDVKSGKRTIPTLEQFIAELPKLNWPEV